LFCVLKIIPEQTSRHSTKMALFVACGARSAIGFLGEPTDEAFNEAVNWALNNKESATSTTHD